MRTKQRDVLFIVSQKLSLVPKSKQGKHPSKQVEKTDGQPTNHTNNNKKNVEDFVTIKLGYCN